MDYATRVQKISLHVNPVTSLIASFKLEKTVSFTDPFHLLSAPTADFGSLRALNGLNQFLLNGDAPGPRQPHRGGRATNTTPTFCERAPKGRSQFHLDGLC
jgi:hypothetical protein